MKRTEPHTIKKEYFGPFSRYALITFRDRFGGITYMVQDAEHINPETGLPLIIRQADTKEAALDGII